MQVSRQRSIDCCRYTVWYLDELSTEQIWMPPPLLGSIWSLTDCTSIRVIFLGLSGWGLVPCPSRPLSKNRSSHVLCKICMDPLMVMNDQMGPYHNVLLVPGSGMNEEVGRRICYNWTHLAIGDGSSNLKESHTISATVPQTTHHIPTLRTRQ